MTLEKWAHPWRAGDSRLNHSQSFSFTCAPQKALGSLERANCKESSSPRNGSPHLHCSLFPSVRIWAILAPPVKCRNQEEIPKPPTFGCFRKWLECPLQVHPKLPMRKLNMVLGEIPAGWRNALVLGLALGTCGVSAGSGVGHGAALHSQPGAASPWTAPGPGLSLGTLGLPSH